MKKILVVISLIVTVNIAVSAQALTLEEARLLALASSRTLAGFENSIRNSVLDERNKLYDLLPSLSASYRVTLPFLQSEQLVNPIDRLTASVNLSLTQIIFQGGKGFVNRAISAISTESTRKAALAEYFNVLDSVDNAYYAVLESMATLEAEEASLQTAEYSLSIAEIRYASGMINQGEYLQALADREARLNSRNQARRNLALNESRLRVLTGIQGSFELEQIDFDRYEGVLHHLSGISDLGAGVLYGKFWSILTVSNPSLARAAFNHQIAEMNLDLIWRDYAPTISVQFSTGLEYNARATQSNPQGFNTPLSGSVTITGTIPVDFWVLSNRIERSEITRDNSARDYINTEIALETDLQSALITVFAQAESVLSTRRSLEYIERQLDYVMERYRLLQSSVSDLSTAASSYINARNNYNRARYSFLQSLSKLRSLCALDDEDLLLGLLMGG